MAKPSNFDELYPGRFLKAGLFKGMKPTLTIKDVDLEELTGEDNKPKQKAILSFVERPMQLCMCKTNGICIREMFGKDLAKWIGKRVTLFAGTWNGEECVRIWGSPDIQKDRVVSVQLPRRKAFDMTMHAVKAGKPEVVAPQTGTLDPRILAGFEILGLTGAERDYYLAERTNQTQAEILAGINAEIDRRTAQEAS